MKVMLRRHTNGHLIVYVAKKDLEEEVVDERPGTEGKILTLANGWELEISDLQQPLKLPQTVEAKRIA
ncbi:putative nitrogen fixation protein NifT [Planktothrix sp. FACHB-1355]|uniref:Nitrogen fixation protein NifT n=1 Tax=Aerosakkonema funiforme FACHB-1375 TaxID=2949571 RepID=A0A926VLA5_9CYAN|nr:MULTISPECIES: putative nitrogen fixation protein NifT [Oscillatoriales]MBD2186010.1 putative nitrogen fixation protein NifT [Aerosakkonema funiforme FACHB-1375]MBD3559903.1 putative nitrogen fixation protein NifT [Planktothrix sp. FACHB-1355]